MVYERYMRYLTGCVDFFNRRISELGQFTLAKSATEAPNAKPTTPQPLPSITTRRSTIRKQSHRLHQAPEGT